MISFAKFVELIDPPSQIPEYIKSFIKDMGNNKKYYVCLYRHAGKRTINELYNKYLKGVK